MEHTPLVSVIIPSYNRRGCIMRSAQSVLSQSVRDIELIIVDDGSTDGTEELFASYPDERLRYLRYEPNRGACYARNYGAERSRGRYIAFQDSDDLWRPEKLWRQLTEIERSGADFVFCGINRVSARGERYFYPVSGFDNEGDALSQFLYENRAGTQTMLMRREVWENTRFDDSIKRYQDWDFAIRAAGRYRLYFINEALVDSSVGESSISASVSAYPALCRLFEKHEAEFIKRPECLARLYRRMGNRLFKDNPRLAAHYYGEEFKLRQSADGAAAYLICAAKARLQRE